MTYVQGEGRSQGTLSPLELHDLVPGDHICWRARAGTPAGEGAGRNQSGLEKRDDTVPIYACFRGARDGSGGIRAGTIVD